MVTLSEMGVIIAPPVPAFYNMPTSIDEIVEHSIGRVLDLFELNSKAVKRWEGMF
jgi:4-hydroxy-3-polyprenylbenzoate decarboxylase